MQEDIQLWQVLIPVMVLGLAAFLVVSIAFDYATWNHGRHRACGGLWWRRETHAGSVVLRCSCGAEREIASWIPRLNRWLTGTP